MSKKKKKKMVAKSKVLDVVYDVLVQRHANPTPSKKNYDPHELLPDLIRQCPDCQENTFVESKGCSWCYRCGYTEDEGIAEVFGKED